jgi:NAD-dependent deacetylase
LPATRPSCGASTPPVGAAPTQAAPNAAHLAVATVEDRPGDRFLIRTQNVDGLHLRAGTRRVLELRLTG